MLDRIYNKNNVIQIESDWTEDDKDELLFSDEEYLIIGWYSNSDDWIYQIRYLNEIKILSQERILNDDDVTVVTVAESDVFRK